MPNDSVANNSVAHVEQLVLDAACSLGKALCAYWPTHGDTGVLEANISLYLAQTLWGAGFYVYTQAHPHGTAQKKVDLLALRADSPLVVVGEFKQLYKADMADAMLKDLERLRAFRPQQMAPWDKAMRIGVLAAFAWAEKFISPFRTQVAAPVSRDPVCPCTAALCAALPQGTVRGAAPLSVPHGKTPRDVGGTRLHLVYAVIPFLIAGGA